MVAVLKFTSGAGITNPFNKATGAGFCVAGGAASKEEIRHQHHFQNACCAGILNSTGHLGAHHLHCSSRRSAEEEWQRQRDALDCTIAILLQKMMPGSTAPSLGASLLQESGKQSTPRKTHSAISAPPGLDVPESQLHDHVDPPELTVSTVRDPPGLYNEATPKVASCTSRLDSTRFNSSSTETCTSMHSHFDESPEKEGWRTLLIAYFPRKTTEGSLQNVFQAFGRVRSVIVVKDRAGLQMCYGFVRFARSSSAEEAYNNCKMGKVSMYDLAGKAWHLTASWAKNAYGKRKSAKRARGQATVHIADMS